jgi:Domain of Unknown Function (DUF1259)
MGILVMDICVRFTRVIRLLFVSLIFVCFGQSISAQAVGSAPETSGGGWKQVESSMGRSGQVQPGNVIKFAMPRTDLQVTLDGVKIKAGFALGSWVAFMQDGTAAMVMGDLVLTEDEVQPVITSLQESGINQSAIHNHLIGESPRVMYVHISSHGEAVQMATAIRKALALTKTPAPDTTPAAEPAPEPAFDAKQVEQILGHDGKIKNGVLQVAVPRAETITDAGMKVPPSMGVATALNFQLMGSGRAAITGDFVLLATEVNPVIKALREHGIAVTALHTHMLREEPRLFFMHFWAVDDALKLAKGLRAALDHTNSAK